MQTVLNTGAQSDRVQRLVALGVDLKAAEAVTVPSAPIVRWLPIRTEASDPAAILFLPCNLGDSAFMYLLVNNGSWRAIDQLTFDCHYDASVTMELAEVLGNNIHNVMVHHIGEGHGTGFSQQNFKLFRVVGGKFCVALDTEEILRVNRPSMEGAAGFEEVQRSVFIVVPSPQRQPYAIEETRTTVLNGRLRVERRRFRWSAKRERFLPTQFLPVVAHD